VLVGGETEQQEAWQPEDHTGDQATARVAVGHVCGKEAASGQRLMSRRSVAEPRRQAAAPVAANSKQYQGGLGARLGKQSGVEAERTTEKYMAVAQRQTAVLAKAGNGQNHPRRVRVPGSEAGD
jgi:hypothetical protein